MNQYDAILQPLLHKIENTHSSAELFIADVLNIVETYNRNAEQNALGLKKAVAIAVNQHVSPAPVPLNGTDVPAPPNGRGGDPRDAVNNLRKQGLQ